MIEEKMNTELNTSAANFQTMEELTREHFYKAMKIAGGNKSQVAKMLDITIKSVYNKIDRYYNESLNQIERKEE